MTLPARLAQFVRCGKVGYTGHMCDFENNGFVLFPDACNEADLNRIETALSKATKDVAGVRLRNIGTLSAEIEVDGCIGAIAAHALGGKARPVRAILFDKTATANWSLGWHQDRTIIVKKRIEAEGFGPWTVKAGLQHVAPPIGILSRMVTLRLHLDPVSVRNAPLLVAIGSHRFGRIAEAKIGNVVNGSETFACLAKRGDVWLYSTLILHASEAAVAPTRRRVLQIDYSADELPGGLEWYSV